MKHCTRESAAVAAALTLLCAAGQAGAAATASASVHDVVWTLIDLNPDDGIAPGIEFSSEAASSVADAGGPGAYDWQAGFTTPTLAAEGSGPRDARASTDGVGSGFAAFWSVIAGFTYASVYPVAAAGFTLTPWTTLVLSGSFSGHARTTLGSDGSALEYAYALGYLQINVNVDNRWESHTASRQAHAGVTLTTAGYTGMDDSFSERFSLGYSNVSGNSISGTMSAFANVQGAGLTPVPEPGTTALMLAGLASVGFVAARRRRESRPG